MKAEVINTPSKCVAFCVDNTVWMSSEDYLPSRWEAQRSAIQQYLEKSKQQHTYAILTAAGRRANCKLPLTDDFNKIYESLDSIQLEGESQDPTALLLSQMTLRNRSNQVHLQHIIWFIGCNLSGNVDQWQRTAENLKKCGVSLSMISFGEESEEKTTILETILNAINKNDNCSLTTFQPGELLTLQTSEPISGNAGIDIRSMRSFLNSPFPPSSSKSKSETAGVPKIETAPEDSSSCRKAVLDNMRYRYVTRHINIPMSSLSLSLEPDGQISIVLPSPRDIKKIVTSCRAGRMTYGEDKVVRPERRKGELSLWVNAESNLIFQWKDLKSRKVEIDITLPQKNVTYQKVNINNDQEYVYLLEFKENSSNNNNNNNVKYTRYFFWNQEFKSSELDTEFCIVVNKHINARDNIKDSSLSGELEFQGLPPSFKPFMESNGKNKGGMKAILPPGAASSITSFMMQLHSLGKNSAADQFVATKTKRNIFGDSKNAVSSLVDDDVLQRSYRTNRPGRPSHRWDQRFSASKRWEEIEMEKRSTIKSTTQLRKSDSSCTPKTLYQKEEVPPINERTPLHARNIELQEVTRSASPTTEILEAEGSSSTPPSSGGSPNREPHQEHFDCDHQN